MMSMMEGLYGKVAPGLCRLSMNGGIAVKTRSGYRTYDPASNRVTNCDHFVLDVGDDCFFVVPTNHVRPGDVILASGTPHCVLSVQEDTLTALNYEDTTVETLMPERHLFLGSTYLYGKIVSIFGRNGISDSKGTRRMMKFMMFSSLMKNKDSKDSAGGMNPLMALMMMQGGDDLMDDLFEIEDSPEKEA